MKMQVFAMYDVKTQMFGTPMFLLTEAQAVRSVKDQVNQAAADNDLFRHPEDYLLYVLGEFDTSSGMFAVGMPSQVAACSELVDKGKGPHVRAVS